MDLQRQVHRLNKELQEAQKDSLADLAASAKVRPVDATVEAAAGDDRALLEKLMGSDIRDLEQALAESAALLEEQKKGHEAMRSRVGELEDECAMLRLEMVTGPAALGQEALQESVRNDVEAKNSEIEARNHPPLLMPGSGGISCSWLCLRPNPFPGVVLLSL